VPFLRANFVVFELGRIGSSLLTPSSWVLWPPLIEPGLFLNVRGRAIAQAVSRWLPTAAARVRARVWSCGICGGQVSLGQVFSQYFGFPWQSSFHQLLHNHPRLSSGACTIGQKWPSVPSGLSPTPLIIIIIPERSNVKHEDGGSMFLWNVCIRLQNYTVSKPRSPQSWDLTAFTVRAFSRLRDAEFVCPRERMCYMLDMR
jgi:hypothetical protein